VIVLSNEVLCDSLVKRGSLWFLDSDWGGDSYDQDDQDGDSYGQDE